MSKNQNAQLQPNDNAQGEATSTVNIETMEVSSSACHGKTDIAWKHFAFKKEGRTNVYTCLHCGNTYRGGGINRMKHHLAGLKGNIAKCMKVPHDICHQMEESLKVIKEKKQSGELDAAYEDELSDQELQQSQFAPPTKKQVVDKQRGKRKANVEIGSYFAPRVTPGSQPSIKSAFCTKEAIHKAKMTIARKECQLLVEGYRQHWSKS